MNGNHGGTISILLKRGILIFVFAVAATQFAQDRLSQHPLSPAMDEHYALSQVLSVLRQCAVHGLKLIFQYITGTHATSTDKQVVCMQVNDHHVLTSAARCHALALAIVVAAHIALVLVQGLGNHRFVKSCRFHLFCLSHMSDIIIVGGHHHNLVDGCGYLETVFILYQHDVSALETSYRATSHF